MAKLSALINPSNLTSGCTAIISKTIGQTFCQLLSLHTTMRLIQPLKSPPSSPIMVTIPMQLSLSTCPFEIQMHMTSPNPSPDSMTIAANKLVLRNPSIKALQIVFVLQYQPPLYLVQKFG